MGRRRLGGGRSQQGTRRFWPQRHARIRRTRRIWGSRRLRRTDGRWRWRRIGKPWRPGKRRGALRRQKERGRASKNSIVIPLSSCNILLIITQISYYFWVFSLPFFFSVAYWLVSSLSLSAILFILRLVRVPSFLKVRVVLDISVVSLSCPGVWFSFFHLGCLLALVPQSGFVVSVINFSMLSYPWVLHFFFLIIFLSDSNNLSIALEKSIFLGVFYLEYCSLTSESNRLCFLAEAICDPFYLSTFALLDTSPFS